MSPELRQRLEAHALEREKRRIRLAVYETEADEACKRLKNRLQASGSSYVRDTQDGCCYLVYSIPTPNLPSGQCSWPQMAAHATPHLVLLAHVGDGRHWLLSPTRLEPVSAEMVAELRTVSMLASVG